MWKGLSKTEAANIMLKWKADETPKPDCNNKMQKVRDDIIDASSKAFDYINLYEDSNNKKEYYYDLRFGLELYTMLKNNFSFSERKASDDAIWIFLSVKVVPDLVYNRWGLNINRFYKQTRRIWLRTIWWYIHLSWSNGKEETYNMLRELTSDEIVQLVERSGSQGYRINVTREIMNQFNQLGTDRDRSLFRKVMKLNTARLKMVEPSLTQGGIKNYVKELIDYFGYANETKYAKETVEFTTSD